MDMEWLSSSDVIENFDKSPLETDEISLESDVSNELFVEQINDEFSVVEQGCDVNEFSSAYDNSGIEKVTTEMHMEDDYLNTIIEKYADKLFEKLDPGDTATEMQKNVGRVGYTMPNIFGGYDYYECINGNNHNNGILDNLISENTKKLFGDI